MNFDNLMDSPNKPEHVREWPSDGGKYEIAFAVSIDGDAFLVSAPESVRNANDECANMDKSGWDDLPDAPGFYKATAEFWFQEGYFEGYPAPGESSFGFALLDCAAVDLAETKILPREAP